MKKRLFIGIKISGILAKEIISWQTKHSLLPVRWIARDNLHLTLIPPWWENDTYSVVNKITSIRQNFPPPFKISTGEIIIGPDSKRPKIIWLEVKSTDELMCLKKVLSKDFEIKNNNNFRPHITIARMKKNYQINTSLSQKTVFHALRAIRFQLFESHLTKSGADYTVIKEFSL